MINRKGLELREDAAIFQSGSQNARALTEDWVERVMFCPNCESSRLLKYENNRPVADFYCSSCLEEFEVKGQKSKFGSRIVDGAYSTMVERLNSVTNPNLVLIQYDREQSTVRNAVLVPKQFFIPEIIEERPPLSSNARRSGWVGCNIRLDRIPALGKIFYVSNGIFCNTERVRSAWQQTLSFRDALPKSRGWLLQVWRVVECIPNQEFDLDEVYAFEVELNRLFPGNNNIRPKIRQQLQLLRDMGLIEFLGRGCYRRLHPA